EIQELTRLKARMEPGQGQSTPLAAWDYAYYLEKLAQRRHGVDANAIRAYFPLDAFVPAVLELYAGLLGVRFQPIEPAHAWAADVLAFAVTDRASRAPLGWFFLDLMPRPGKGLHYAHYGLRAGRTLPNGDRQLPI